MASLSTLATPGVYIREISTLPASVAPVSTAVPAFIGYTEKGPSAPTRITSMIEYNEIFGGAFNESYEVDITDGDVLALSASDSPYIMYYHLLMYFGNGGGPCHIVSVGNYNYTTPAIDVDDFYDLSDPTVGIGQAELVDEVTLLVVPEAAELSASNYRAVNDALLAQCNKLKDRFTIMDVNSTGDPSADALAFRNSNVSANFLNYGAAYYPPLDTILKRAYSADDVLIDDQRSGTDDIYATEPNNRLSTISGGVGISTTFKVDDPAIGTITITAFGSSAVLTTGLDFVGTGTPDEIVASIIAAINNHATLSLLVRAQVDSTDDESLFIVTRTGSDTAANLTVVLSNGTWTTPASPVSIPGSNNSEDLALYNSITALIGERVVSLNPSGTMAGIYASVDNSRGVWKAPANVSVANIIGPSFQITEAQQGGLNVDATSGKSINAIRSFVGRGTIVWGARTLEGNSNEWRYVPVRRLFIFVEESCKKASEFVVFEPNDMNTWLRVKGMISNFLTDLWKQGALAGAKPEDAFFVSVGLGETMTAQDILEGKMIVSIGMAAVRPAEFIVLDFMHQLQQS